MEIDPSVLSWLLEGDVSIQYQAHRNLLGQDRPDLQARSAQEGWGARAAGVCEASAFIFPAFSTRNSSP